MVEIIGPIVLERRPEILDDDETRWRLENALDRTQARERAQGGHSVRVGATQDLLALNVDLASVMREGCWKTVRMPMRYGEHVMAARGGMARAAKEQGRDVP
jgi:hypothetical protein